MPSGKHNSHVRGSAHPRWNPDRIYDKNGYVMIRVGASHAPADPRGYAYEHVLVAAAQYGVNAVIGKVVHHINGDYQDNRISNLEIDTRSEHSAYHVRFQPRGHAGRFAAAGRGD